MKSVTLLVVLLLLAATALLNAENSNMIGGFGGFPLSSDLTSMWLAGADGRPAIMAYFHGPEGWHQMQWASAGEIAAEKPVWAEFRADTITLRLWWDPKTGDVEVQSEKYNVAANNTFLVVYVGEKVRVPKVIPLGVFQMPDLGEEPPSILLLRASPELVKRIEKELGRQTQ